MRAVAVAAAAAAHAYGDGAARRRLTETERWLYDARRRRALGRSVQTRPAAVQ